MEITWPSLSTITTLPSWLILAVDVVATLNPKPSCLGASRLCSIAITRTPASFWAWRIRSVSLCTLSNTASPPDVLLASPAAPGSSMNNSMPSEALILMALSPCIGMSKVLPVDDSIFRRTPVSVGGSMTKSDSCAAVSLRRCLRSGTCSNAPCSASSISWTESVSEPGVDEPTSESASEPDVDALTGAAEMVAAMTITTRPISADERSGCLRLDGSLALASCCHGRTGLALIACRTRSMQNLVYTTMFLVSLVVSLAVRFSSLLRHSLIRISPRVPQAFASTCRLERLRRVSCWDLGFVNLSDNAD